MDGMAKQMRHRHRRLLDGLLHEITALQGELRGLHENLQQSQITLSRINVGKEEHRISAHYRAILKNIGHLLELQSYDLPFNDNARSRIATHKTLTLVKEGG